MSYMMWADYRFIASTEFFNVTREIRNIEDRFHSHVQVGYMNDSMHNTRRFEYPWVVTCIPYKRGMVLDVGSGTSSLMTYLAPKCGEYYALDYDAEAIKQIDLIRETLGIKNLRPVYCNAEVIDVFPSDAFDVTISVSVIEHMNKDAFKKAIDEIVRVTKPGGVILLTMDVSTTKDSERTDLEDLKWITDKFHIDMPPVTSTTMVNMVTGSNVPFYVACMSLRGFK